MSELFSSSPTNQISTRTNSKWASYLKKYKPKFVETFLFIISGEKNIFFVFKSNPWTETIGIVRDVDPLHEDVRDKLTLNNYYIFIPTFCFLFRPFCQIIPYITKFCHEMPRCTVWIWTLNRYYVTKIPFLAIKQLFLFKTSFRFIMFP